MAKICTMSSCMVKSVTGLQLDGGELQTASRPLSASKENSDSGVEARPWALGERCFSPLAQSLFLGAINRPVTGRVRLVSKPRDDRLIEGP